VSEPASGITAALAVEGVDLGGGAFALPLPLAFEALVNTPGSGLLGDAIEDAGEVAIAGPGDASASAIAQPSLGLLDVVEGVTAVSTDEGREGAEHLIALVDVGEEEPLGTPLGASAVALVVDEVAELIGVGPGEGMDEIGAAEVIDLKESVEEELGQGTGQPGIGQLGQSVSQAVGECEESGHGALDRLEGAFDGGLVGWCSLLLRAVLQIEGVVGGGGLLSHVGCALVGDQLDAARLRERLGDHGGDLVGGLFELDAGGLEQVLIALAGVLEGDEPELDPEQHEIGGVGE
jgi:hypothetical protein